MKTTALKLAPQRATRAIAMRTTGRQHGPVKRLVSPSNLGSAMPHPHDLVLGYYSVHTSAEALRTGEARIVEIATDLRRQGRIV